MRYEGRLAAHSCPGSPFPAWLVGMGQQGQTWGHQEPHTQPGCPAADCTLMSQFGADLDTPCTFPKPEGWGRRWVMNPRFSKRVMCSIRIMRLQGMAKQSVFLLYPRDFCSVPSSPQELKCPSVCLSTGERDRDRQTDRA